jgi:hypothetical protein
MNYKDQNYYKKFQKFLKEDETDDKLDDLSNEFDSGNIPGYVTKLQQYLSDPKVAAVIKAGQTDARGAGDEALKSSGGSIAASMLYPTQNEVGAAESLANICTDKYGSLASFLKGSADLKDPVITYNGQWILDGHHRWSQIYAANPDCKIPVLNITGKLTPAQILMAVHTAIAAKTGKDDTKSANLAAGNLLSFGKDQTIKTVKESLTDNARAVWKANGFADDDAIANHIANNVEQMISKNGPKGWAPDRSAMPQPGDNGADDFDKVLATGMANFNEPKKADAKESKIQKRLDNYLQESIKKSNK